MGENPLAPVVVMPGDELSEEQIISFARQKLADYKTPKKVIFLDELRTPTGIGKLRQTKREEIRQPAQDGTIWYQMVQDGTKVNGLENR